MFACRARGGTVCPVEVETIWGLAIAAVALLNCVWYEAKWFLTRNGHRVGWLWGHLADFGSLLQLARSTASAKVRGGARRRLVLLGSLLVSSFVLVALSFASGSHVERTR